jgi:hypothetical protein
MFHGMAGLPAATVPGMQRRWPRCVGTAIGVNLDPLS